MDDDDGKMMAGVHPGEVATVTKGVDSNVKLSVTAQTCLLKCPEIRTCVQGGFDCVTAANIFEELPSMLTMLVVKC